MRLSIRSCLSEDITNSNRQKVEGSRQQCLARAGREVKQVNSNNNGSNRSSTCSVDLSIDSWSNKQHLTNGKSINSFRIRNGTRNGNGKAQIKCLSYRSPALPHSQSAAAAALSLSAALFFVVERLCQGSVAGCRHLNGMEHV